jgi:hypothetical protein
MTKDVYWDELGLAWCAIDPETEVISCRLEERLRVQSFLITAGAVAGLSFGLIGALVGAYSVWRGFSLGLANFVARGAVLIGVAFIPAVAALKLLPVLSGNQAKTLPEMINLSIARAERLLIAMRLGWFVSVVLAGLELTGMGLRAYAGRPPAMPLVLELALLSVLLILALGSFWYGRQVNLEGRKFRYLQHALAQAPA